MFWINENIWKHLFSNANKGKIFLHQNLLQLTDLAWDWKVERETPEGKTNWTTCFVKYHCITERGVNKKINLKIVTNKNKYFLCHANHILMMTNSFWKVVHSVSRFCGRWHKLHIFTSRTSFSDTSEFSLCDALVRIILLDENYLRAITIKL